MPTPPTIDAARMDKAEAVIEAYLEHVNTRGRSRETGPVEIESLVHASDVLARQLMDCVSNDRALEDVLYEVCVGEGKCRE